MCGIGIFISDDAIISTVARDDFKPMDAYGIGVVTKAEHVFCALDRHEAGTAR